MNLKLTTARNSMFMGGVLLIMRPINFTLSIILARLLDPGDFGLITLALVLVQSSNLFTNLGMDKAIIQSKDDIKKVAFQAFVIVFMTSALFCGLMIAYSETLALGLGDVRTAPILRWLSAIVLLGGLSVVPTSLLRKQLKFQYISLANLASIIVYAISVLYLAYSGWGIWSLVYSNLLSTVVATILHWIWCPGWDWIIPKPWDNALMKRLFSYGVQVTGSGLLGYFHTHWDDWLVGRTLGVTALGFYSKAFDFSNGTIGQLAKNTIGMVFFPSYAKIQDDKVRLARAYLKTVRLVFLFVTPFALGITVVAAPLVQVLFGTKWMPMVTVLQIFSLLILTRPVSENSAPVFQALGLPSYNTRAGFVLLASMIPGVLYLIQWQIEGVALAVALSHLIGAFYNVYQINTLLPGTAKATLKITMPILLSGIIMALGVHFVKVPVAKFFGNLDNLPALLTLVGTGVVIYLVLLLITQRDLIRELWQILRALVPRKLGMGRRLRNSESTIQ